MKPLIGIHLSFWQEQWNDDLRPLIGKAKRAGYDIAEFPLLSPGKLDYAGLRSELDDLGMKATCSTGLGLETDITSPNEEIRKSGITYLRSCIEGARKLDSPILAGVTYAPWAVFPSDDFDLRRKQCIQSMKEVAQMGQDNGVTICMEVLNRFEGYLINTAKQGVELIKEIDHENIKLQLDTFHMNIEEDDIGDAIRTAGVHLGHLHCVGNNRKIPGEGHIPWKDVRDAINEINYKGSIVAETFVNPAGEVGRGLFIWRPLAANLDEAASKSATFLRDLFSN